MILEQCAIVEENFRKAVRSLERGDLALAREVIEKDNEIDKLEVELEEDCLKVLALHQPVAVDLRFIISVLKINQSLERIGDMAVKIAFATEQHAHFGESGTKYELSTMADKTKSMLKRSLDALVEMDTELARQVREDDEEVNDLKRRVYASIVEDLKQDPDKTEYLLSVNGVARYLERIGDHASKIAEDVIYMSEAVILRHRDHE